MMLAILMASTPLPSEFPNMRHNLTTQPDTTFPEFRGACSDLYVVSPDSPYPNRWSVVLVPEGQSARKETGGPKIAGPWAYSFEHGGVLAANPRHGSGYKNEQGLRDGSLIHAAIGDEVTFPEDPTGIYTIVVIRSHWIELVRN